MRRLLIKHFILIALFSLPRLNSFAAAKPIRVTDDLGHKLILTANAKHVITIAPNLTQMAIAAGAENKIIAVDNKSQLPQKLKHLPRVASYDWIDIEKILLLKPDLILATYSQTERSDLRKLKRLDPKLIIYISNLKNIRAIATTIQKIGRLTGSTKVANKSAQKFLSRYRKIKKQYQNHRTNKKVFYQLWQRPLMTVNRNSLITEAINICGGINIFSSLPTDASEVNIESVITKNPDIIVASQNDDAWQQRWKKWPNISAVKHKHFITLSPHSLESYSLNILTGVSNLCAKMHH